MQAWQDGILMLRLTNELTQNLAIQQKSGALLTEADVSDHLIDKNACRSQADSSHKVERYFSTSSMHTCAVLPVVHASYGFPQCAR